MHFNQNEKYVLWSYIHMQTQNCVHDIDLKFNDKFCVKISED